MPPKLPSTRSHADSQAARRMKYGLNVAVAVAAAVALVVLLNVVSQRWVQRNVSVTRFDFTATRQYSLSQQTRLVLRELTEPIRLVTLLTGGGEETRRVRDLVDEYARRSGRISVEHIDPSFDLTRLDQFYTTITGRFETPLKPLRDAIDQGKATLDRQRTGLQEVVAQTQALRNDPALTRNTSDAGVAARSFVEQVAQTLAGADLVFAARQQQIERDLGQSLPDYAAARDAIETFLSELEQSNLAPLLRAVQQRASAAGTPDAARDGLLRLADRVRALRETIAPAISALRAASDVPEYSTVVQQLASPNTVAVVGARRVRVLDADAMFRAPETPASDAAAEQGRRTFEFQGEDQLTNALVSINLEHPPLVVFVSSDQGQALGPQGNFNHVAQRLRDAGFDVEQWSPSGQMSPWGQPIPPGPAPAPKPGQKAAWVLLPTSSPNPQMAAMGAAGEQAVTDLARQRIAAGDGVLVMLAPSQEGAYSESAVQAWLKEWGVAAQTDRMVVEGRTGRDGKESAVRQHEVVDWPDGLPIGKALAGMPGMFVAACPLSFSSDADRPIEHWPVARITGDRLWAETRLWELDKARYDDKAAGRSFDIALALQKQGDGTRERMLVIADPVFAADAITTYGVIPGVAAQAGLAQLVGARFPANAELFVNGVYWLTGMDRFIAASARTQDMRRVAAIRPDSLAALRWGMILGLPLAVAVVGIGVAFVRRRG